MLFNTVEYPRVNFKSFCENFCLRLYTMANVLNLVFSDTSSDEENNLLPRKVKVYKNRRNSGESDFRALYRFSRPNLELLINYFLADEAEETRGGSLNARQKMKTFLRYIGDPGFQVSIKC